MSAYRELYNHIADNSSIVDDLLREQGIDAKGNDRIRESQYALLVLFAMRINELEERLSNLEK